MGLFLNISEKLTCNEEKGMEQNETKSIQQILIGELKAIDMVINEFSHYRGRGSSHHGPKTFRRGKPLHFYIPPIVQGR